MKVDKRVYSYLEYELYHYQEYQKELLLEKERIIESMGRGNGCRATGTSIGDSTAKKAILLTEGISVLALERVVQAIDRMLSLLSQEHRQIFHAIYIKKKEDSFLLADEMGISIETLKRRKRDIIYLFGKELGVIRFML